MLRQRRRAKGVAGGSRVCGTEAGLATDLLQTSQRWRQCVKTRTAFHTNQLNVQERCGEYREGPTCPEEGRVQGRPLPCACGLILGKLLEVLQFFE